MEEFYLIEESTLTAIADAIRTKRGTNFLYDPEEYASEILSIGEPVAQMQTLTIVNVNNPSETVSFTMPSGYLFTDFIGSEYDTSGGAFSGTSTLRYNGFTVYDNEALGDSIATSSHLASGTFYYEGESATQTLTLINLKHEQAPELTFTMPIGWTFSQFIGSEYDTSGGKFSITSDSGYVLYDGNEVTLDGSHLSVRVGADSASGTFYYSGESATQTLTVINSNNPSETATFTMPSGYDFGELEADTTINLNYVFSAIDSGTDAGQIVHYKGYMLIKANGDPAFDWENASGTFYYEGEFIYTLSGVYEFVSMDDTPDLHADITFTSNGQTFSHMEIDIGGAEWIYYDDLFVWSLVGGWRKGDGYKIVDFGNTPQTVSKTFYDVFTSIAEQRYPISRTWALRYDASAWSSYGSIALNFASNGSTFKCIVSDGDDYVDISGSRGIWYSQADSIGNATPNNSVWVKDNYGNWKNEAYKNISIVGTQYLNAYDYDTFTSRFDVVLISFTIEDVPYQAIEGMTWEEWVNSKYNTDGYYIYPDTNYDYIVSQNGDYSVVCKGIRTRSIDLIIEGEPYYMSPWGGGN